MKQSRATAPLAYRLGAGRRARLIAAAAIADAPAVARETRLDAPAALRLLAGLEQLLGRSVGTPAEFLAGGAVTRALGAVARRHEPDPRAAARLVARAIAANPAAGALAELLGDEDPDAVRDTSIDDPARRAHRPRFAESALPAVGTGYEITELLALPARRAPTSLVAQARWIATRWGDALDLYDDALDGPFAAAVALAESAPDATPAPAPEPQAATRSSAPVPGPGGETVEAPPEAVRAIAALLGRAAAPRRSVSAPRAAATPGDAAPDTAPTPRRPKRAAAPSPRRSGRRADTREVGEAAARPVAAAKRSAPPPAPVEANPFGDREVPIEGLAPHVAELSGRERQRARKRLKRARKMVKLALERLSSYPEDELGG
ncbi:MAG: hypothetical protein RLZZ432_806 [Chloroflexota bacterium]